MRQWCEIGHFQHSYTLVKVEVGAWGLFSPPHTQLAAGGRKRGLKDSLDALSEGEVPVPIRRFTNQMFMAWIWFLEQSDSAKCTASALQSDAVSKRASDKWGKSGLRANVFAFLIEDRETTMHSLNAEGGFTHTCNQSTGRPLLVWAGVWKVITESALGFTKAGGFSCLQTHTYAGHQPLNRST